MSYEELSQHLIFLEYILLLDVMHCYKITINITNTPNALGGGEGEKDKALCTPPPSFIST